MNRKKLLNFLQFLLFLSIGLGILLYVYHQQNTAFQEQCRLDGTPADKCSLIGKILNDFRNVNVIWIILVLIAFTISNISRSIRWNMLIRELGYHPRTSNAFYTIMISYLTNLWMSRMGEVVRAGSMAKYEKISTSKVMGTVIVDRILDFVCLGVVVGLAFLLEFDTFWTYLKENAHFGNGSASFMTSPWLWGSIALFTIGLVVLYLMRSRFAHINIYQRVREIMKSMWEGFKTVKYVDQPFWFVFHSINIWVMYYLMTYLCFFAYAPTANLGGMAALTVFVFGTFGMVIPSPGGMGTYHVLVIAALSVYGINKIDAFSFANIIFFSIQIFCSILMGLISVIMLPISNRNYHPQPVDTHAPQPAFFE